MTAQEQPDLTDYVMEGTEYNTQSAYNIGWYKSVHPEERYMKYLMSYLSVLQAIQDGEQDSLNEMEMAFVLWAAEDDEAFEAGADMMDAIDDQTRRIHNFVFGPGNAEIPGFEGIEIPRIDTQNVEEYQVGMGRAIFNDGDYSHEFTQPHAKHSKQLSVYHILDRARNEIGGGLDAVAGLMGTADEDTYVDAQEALRNPTQEEYWAALRRDSYGPTSTYVGAEGAINNMARIGIDLAMFQYASGAALTAAKGAVNAASKGLQMGSRGRQVSQAIANGLDKISGTPRTQGAAKSTGRKITDAILGEKGSIRRKFQGASLVYGIGNTGYQAWRATQFNPDTANYMDEETFNTLEGYIGEENLKRMLDSRYRTPEQQEEQFNPQQQARYDEFVVRSGGRVEP